MILYRIALDPDNSRTKGCKSAVGLRQDLAASLGGDGFTNLQKITIACNLYLQLGFIHRATLECILVLPFSLPSSGITVRKIILDVCNPVGLKK